MARLPNFLVIIRSEKLSGKGQGRGAKKRTFRLGKKNVSFPKVETFRFADYTCWQGNKGDYITFALENGAKIDGLSIAWKKENTGEADFEIQLSGGGGQFLTVYSGSVSKFNEWMSYTFKGTTASDLRILLNSDGLGVAEVKINQLKKE